MWSGTVSEFIALAQSSRLTAAIRSGFLRAGNRVSPYEENAWDQSLPALARILAGQGLDAYEIHILAEVALPGASSRADVVLLGRTGAGGRGAVIIELKQWKQARGAKPEYVTLGDTFLKLHPCAQVQGYRDYLTLYAAALVDRTPASVVAGCAYLHNLVDVAPLRQGWGATAAAVNGALMDDCPAFGRPDGPALAAWLRKQLPQPPSDDFVEEFGHLEKRASRQLMQSFRDIVNSGHNPWVLLDFQKDAMARIQEALGELTAGDAPARRVIVVSGGPGSGKTVIALSALMAAFADHGLAQSYLVTTSSAQHHAIDGEISLAKREPLPPTRKVSHQPVLKAATLRVRAPNLVTGQKNSAFDDAAWNAYCAKWREHHLPHVEEPDFDVIIVDEAQGLVMPNKPHVDGSQANAWRRPYGPQPWHVMMRSRLTVFFLDADQGYRQVESTTPTDILALAAAEGIPAAEISLGSEQFRVAGGRAYLAWLDHIFGFTSEPPPPITVTEQRRLPEIFALDDHPGRMRDRLRELHGDGENARLLAGYAWEWRSKNGNGAVDSHTGLKLPGRTPPPGLAFSWAIGDADGQRAFNLGTPPYDTAAALFGRGADEPATAGYPLTVRGRDMDHVGVLWGQDLLWRNGRWQVDTELVFGSDMPGLRKAAREELKRGIEDGPKMQALVRAVAGAYRILLTRGMQTVRVWIEDPETAAYVAAEWESFLRHVGQEEGYNV